MKSSVPNPIAIMNPADVAGPFYRFSTWSSYMLTIR